MYWLNTFGPRGSSARFFSLSSCRGRTTWQSNIYFRSQQSNTDASGLPGAFKALLKKLSDIFSIIFFPLFYLAKTQGYAGLSLCPFPSWFWLFTLAVKFLSDESIIKPPSITSPSSHLPFPRRCLRTNRISRVEQLWAIKTQLWR